MNEQLDRIIKVIPLATIVVYIVGYLAVALHNGKYGPVQADILNLQYLRVGFLILFLSAVPIFTISFNYRNRTDNALMTKNIIAPLFHRTFELSWLTILALNIDRLGSIYKTPFDPIAFVIYHGGLAIFVASFFVAFYFTSYSARNIGARVKNFWYIAIIICEISFLLIFGNESIRYYVEIVVLLTIFCFVFLGLVADGSSDLRGLAASAGTFILLAGIFSNSVLPGIPEKFGGFESSPVKFAFKHEESQTMANLGIQLDDKDISGPVVILAESQGVYVIETKIGYIQVRKDYLISVIKEK